MGRKVSRVRVHLDFGAIEKLSIVEIKTILRGADPLIKSGGRTMLAKILKGSREKRLLELELDKCPVYGFFRHLSFDEITAKIDWLITHGYLAIEYDYRLPLLIYTPLGWEIEKKTYADELFQEVVAALAGHGEFPLNYLKDGNRDIIQLLLQKIEATDAGKYISLLEAWQKVASKKMRARINQAINGLRKLGDIA